MLKNKYPKRLTTLAIALSAFIISGCGDDLVEQVKKSIVSDKPSTTYEQLVQNYPFCEKDHEWLLQKDPKGKPFVQFSCRLSSSDIFLQYQSSFATKQQIEQAARSYSALVDQNKISPNKLMLTFEQNQNDAQKNFVLKDIGVYVEGRTPSPPSNEYTTAIYLALLNNTSINTSLYDVDSILHLRSYLAYINTVFQEKGNTLTTYQETYFPKGSLANNIEQNYQGSYMLRENQQVLTKLTLTDFDFAPSLKRSSIKYELTFYNTSVSDLRTYAKSQGIDLLDLQDLNDLQANLKEWQVVPLLSVKGSLVVDGLSTEYDYPSVIFVDSDKFALPILLQQHGLGFKSNHILTYANANDRLALYLEQNPEAKAKQEKLDPITRYMYGIETDKSKIAVYDRNTQ